MGAKARGRWHLVARYRKLPVEVEAVQFTGANAGEIAELLGWECTDRDGDADTIVIETLEGNMVAGVGDWIIKGVAGEGYPCRPDVFELTYEPVN
jgi:hypothetical protein